MIFNQIKGGGKARVSVINGPHSGALILIGMAVGASTFRIPMNELGEGSAEVNAGGYNVYWDGVANPTYKYVRLYTGPNVIDMGE